MATQKKFDVYTIIIILVFAVFMNVGGMKDKFTDWLSSEVEEIQDDAIQSYCNHDRATMTIGRMNDAFSPSTSVTTEYSRVFVNGQDRGLVIDGSSMVVTPGKDKIDLFYAVNSSIYYAAYENFTVPCVSAFSTSEFGDGSKLLKSNNEDSSNISGNWNCETSLGVKITATNTNDFVADEWDTIFCEIRSISDEVYSPYGKPAVCLEFNPADFDNVEIGNTKAFSTPQYVGLTNANVNQSICYPIDSITDLGKIKYTISIRADATYNTTSDAGHIKQFLIDQDWFKNSDNGEMQFDYQTETYGDVGSTNELTYVIYGG